MLIPLQKLPIPTAADMQGWLVAFLSANQFTIRSLVQNQLSQGQKPDGSAIRPPYTRNTVSIKKDKGQPYSKVTLRDTGAFYKSIFADVMKDQFAIDATDIKWEELAQKYGDEVLGLSPQNIKKLAGLFLVYARGRVIRT